MTLDHIVFQSAGSLAVAILGLFMVILQVRFVWKRPRFKWFGWSAAISFSGMLYAVGIFIEYNTAPGAFNRFAGILEFSALLGLVHSLYGFTFSYFGLKGSGYHLIAAPFHIFLLVLLWSTDSIVAEAFRSINLIWLAAPYQEADMGPLGVYFELYAALASMGAILFFIRHKGPDPGYRSVYATGMILWLAFGVHDALASLGVPSVQYVMEYGYFCFSAAVLWILFSSYADMSAEDKYRVITEYANDAILVIQDGKMVFGNPACGRLFHHFRVGVSVTEVLALILPSDRETFSEYYRRISDGVECTRFFTIRTEREGKPEKTLEIRADAIGYRDRPAVLAVLRDVTDRVREEEARRESEEKILRLRKMESLGLLAGGVAHDLNNVLSGIINYPELMLMQLPQGSPLIKYVAAMRASGLKAAAIVQDLLTVARGVAVSKESMSVNGVIRGYLASPECKKLLQYHPLVTIRESLDPTLPNINGSPVHVGKVVMNLVSNAAEAIQGEGTVLIATETRRLEAPLEGAPAMAPGEYAVLSVTDTGPGIHSEDLSKIFEPFYTKKEMGRSGTGLGLTLVWNVMQDHQGYVNVKGDAGTTFELYFPATRALPEAKRKPVAFETLRGNREAVLVVDDVESQRELFSSMLDALNYTPHTVPGGEAAVAYMERHTVGLLLLDMVMDPGMNGCETYRRIARIHPGQKALIVSGFAETDQVREALGLGGACFLKKPVTLEELGTALKTVFSGGTVSRVETNFLIS